MSESSHNTVLVSDSRPDPGIATDADTRTARHKSLMLRSAKVVCQTGEYVCLVRDVCEVATSLSFLHDVPPETRIILYLANGHTYPIERVWSGKRQAGYRFTFDVAPEDFKHETGPYETRPTRLDIKAPAQILDGHKTYGAQLLDISNHGAKFECASLLQEHRLLGFRVSGMNQRLGQIVWTERKGPESTSGARRYGIQFQHPIALQELANAALRLQPFDAPTSGGVGSAAKRGFGESLSKARAAAA